MAKFKKIPKYEGGSHILSYVERLHCSSQTQAEQLPTPYPPAPGKRKKTIVASPLYLGTDSEKNSDIPLSQTRSPLFPFGTFQTRIHFVFLVHNQCTKLHNVLNQ